MKSSLNRIFKVIWSKVQMAWVAVSEATTAHGKQQSITRITRTVTTVAMLSGGAAIAAPPAPNQLPTGGQVAAGIAAIGTNGNTMTVTQSSNRAAINWNTFDIGSQAAVNFVQPSANAVALNRVNSPNPSQIYGQLSANGQVYLINPAGVYFAPGAQVNVGGIVATTMSMSDAAFMAGSTTFNRNGSTGKVINEGTIQTSLNGYIAMLAPEVRNSGLLLAQSGTVAMGAGESITLNFGPTSKLESITVTEAQLDTLVENRHAIKAPNGLVILSARAANQLAASVVNSGTIEAKGVSQQGGRILLEGSTVTNTGTLDVSSDTAQAGTIQINGKNVSISGNVIATSPTQGGTVKVLATETLNASNANINASGQQGGQIQLAANQLTVADSSLNADGDTQGGSININGAGPTNAADVLGPNHPLNNPLAPPTGPSTVALAGSTTISTRSRYGRAGQTTVTGDHISLLDTTNIDATGATAGGTVLVGGDWQGSNGVYQATTVYMGANTNIDASATDNGNGGKVVLWSDVANANGWTRAHGRIYAMGGANGGDGGKIETSGHWLDTEGVSGSAASSLGLSGEWLFDPYNVAIVSGTQQNGAFSGNVWSPSGSSSQISNTSIQNLLNTGTSVTVTTSGGGSERGDVSVNAPISKTAGGEATLTLRAHGGVWVSNSISSTTGKLNLVLWSDYDNNNDAGVAINAQIQTNGGHLWAGGSNTNGGSKIWNGLTVGDGASVGNSSANWNALDINANITTGGGDVLLWAATGVNTYENRDGIGLYGDHTINVGSGNVSLIAAKIYRWDVDGTLTVSTSGKLTVAPNIAGDWTSGLNWTGATSGADFTLTNIGGSGRPLKITNIANLGGLTLGRYEGTGLNGDTFVTPDNTQNITISSGINISGPINLYGGNISVNANLTTTNATTGDVLLKATGNITQAASVNVATGGGDVTFWADSDANNSGAIVLEANANVSTSGGSITLGGGSDPLTGYAFASATSGNYINGITLLSGSKLLSGGGDITLHGQSTQYVYAVSSGIYGETVIIDAGMGVVSITGKQANAVTTNTNAQAITFGNASIYSNSTSTEAISIIGNASGAISSVTSLGINFYGNSTIQTLGTGGGIYINGSAGTGSAYEAGITFQNNTSILSSSGPIVIESNNTVAVTTSKYDLAFLGTIALGAKAGSGVTSSSANITLRANDIWYSGVSSVATTGSLTIEPLGTSFTSALTYPNGNLSVSSGLTGLTLGKSGNTANITIGSAQSVAGPINIYGGNITLTGGLTTTNSTTGHIGLTGNVSGAGNIVLATGRALTVTQNGSSTYSGCVSGTSSQLVKAGAGTWTLSGVNTYTGSTNVTAGTLVVTGSLSDTTAVNVSSGAAYNVSASDMIGSFTGGGTINLGSGYTLTAFGDNTDGIFSGGIAGAGALSKVGTGKLTLSGTNSYTGGTSVTAGVLQVGNGGETGSLGGGNININNAMLAFNYSAGNYSVGNTTSTAYITLNNATVNVTSGNVTLSGYSSVSGTAQGAATMNTAVNLTGTNNLTAADGATLNLLGNSTGSNAHSIALQNNSVLNTNGSVRLTANGATGTGSHWLLGLYGNTAINALSGSTLQVNVTQTAGDWGVIQYGTGAATATTGNVTFNVSAVAGDWAGFNGAIIGSALSSDNGTLTINLAGAGVMQLNGPTTFNATSTGNIVINGSSNVSLGAATTITTGAGNLTINAPLALNANILTLSGGSGNVLLGGVVSGAGGLVQSTSGNLTLSATNTYSGTTTINNGATLIVNGSGSLNSGDYTAGITNNGSFVYNSSANQILSGVVSGMGSLTQNGLGALTLASNSTYTGETRIGSGSTLRLGNGSSLATLTTSGITNNGTLVYDSNQDQTVSYSISGTGAVTVVGESRTLFNSYLTTTAQTIANNMSVAEALSRLSIAKTGGAYISSGGNGGIYNAVFDPTSNTGTFQVQIYDSGLTKVIFVKLTQSGTDVQAQAYQGKSTNYAVYASGNLLGTDFTTATSTGMGFVSSASGNGYGVASISLTSKAIFSGTNTYSGTTTTSNTDIAINGGTAIAKGVIQIGDGSTTGSLASSQINNNGLVIFNRTDSSELVSNISGSGRIIQAGSGETQITGDLTHTGGTIVNAGTLSIGAGGTYGSISNAVVNRSNITFNRSDSVSYGSVVSGMGNLSQVGSGTLTLSGANTYSGNTTISSGTLLISSDNNLGTAPGSATAGKLVFNGGTLATVTNLTLNANRGISLGANGGGFHVAAGATLTYSGVATGSGSLLKAGSGTLTLSGVNIFTGGTNITAGTLIAGNSNPSSSLADTGAVNVESGATYQLGGSETIGALTGAGSVVLGSHTLTSYNGGGTGTFGGVISGTGHFAVAANASVTLTGNSTYTGETVLYGNATLTLGAGGASGNVGGSFRVSFRDGSVLRFNRSDDLNFTADLNDQGGTQSLIKDGAGVLTLSSSSSANSFDGNITVNNGTLNVTGGVLGASNTVRVQNNNATVIYNSSATQNLSVLNGTGVFQKLGSGTLQLANASGFTGATTVTGGVLDLRNSVIGGNVTNNADLWFNTWVGTATYGNIISGTGNVMIHSGANVTLTGDNTYTGTTTNYGSLRLGAGGTTGSVAAAGGIASTGNVYFNRSDNPTYAGVISGTGHVHFVKSATLTGNSTFTGETVLMDNATLTLGSGGTSGNVGGSFRVSFRNGSVLRFNRSDDLDFTADLNNQGSTNYLVKDGAGVLTLSSTSSANSFNGNITVNAGTLNVTGGVLGASNNVRIQNNDATVIYNTSATQNLSVLNGTGVFQKLGTGTLQLATSSGFTGETTVSGGVLDLRNSVIGGNVTNNADVWFNTWVGTATYGNIVSGTGNVTIHSGADVTFTGANTYTGTTTVYGSLRVGANGTVGSLASSGISGSGTVFFNRSDASSYAGAMSGTLEFKKYGLGTLTLTGDSSYTRATNVYEGTLQLGNGSATGSVASNIALSSGATVAFNRSGDVAVANNISGSGGKLAQIGSGALILTGAATYTGNTNVTIGSLVFTNNATPSTSGFIGNGTVSIQPAGSAFSTAFSTGIYSYASTLTGLTIGNASSSANANITVNAALSIAGNINLYGGNVTVNSALTTSNSGIIRLAAASGGNITQGASGNITTSGLALLGGNVNLTNVNNSVSTLAASGVGNLSFVNAGNLTIGTVNPTGVNVTGTVNITVQSGNISLTEAISTNSAASNAIVLNAGAGTAAGTATGGNILVSGNGSVTVGIGGRATLFTGSIANSSGLTALVGSGSGNFRYNSNATSTGYNSTAAALGAGTYAVYREQPTLTVTANNVSSTYGTTPVMNVTNTDVNGDTLAQIYGSGNIPTTSIDGNTSTAGFYTAGTHNITLSSSSASILGYGSPTLVNGTLTVAQAQLTVTGTQVANTTYNNSTAATFSNNGTLAGVLSNATSSVSDVVTVTVAGNFSSSNVGTNLSVTMNSTLGGADAANYVLTQPSSLTGNITAKNVTLTLGNASKVYSGNTSYTANASDLAALSALLGVSGDTVTGITLTYDTKNVGTGKTLVASAANISSGNSNYNITYTDTTDSTITRLSSVTWTGGSTGNWFDANNWAGGAVPDLSNVETVIIPTGVTSTFGSATAGAVNITGLQAAAATLYQTNGTLNVGSGGIALSNLTQAAGNITTTGDIATSILSGAGGNISLGAGTTLNVTQSTSSSYAGCISGAGSLVKDGSGVLTLSAAQTYTGNTNVTAGTLAVSGSLADAAVVNVSSGASYNVSASDTIGEFAGSGTINLGSGYTLTAFGDNSDGSFAGVLAGQGNLVKAGTGNLTLTGANTYTGSTTINAGSLIVERDAPTFTTSSYGGAGNLTIQSAGASFTSALSLSGSKIASTLGSLTIGKATNTQYLYLSGNFTTVGSQTYNSSPDHNSSTGYDAVNRGVRLASDSIFTTTNSDIVFNATVWSSSGAMNLTVNSGTGDISFLGNMGTWTGADARSLASLSLTGGAISAHNIRASSITINNAADSIITGRLAWSTTGVTKDGAGKLTLTTADPMGNNLYTGGLTITGGTVSASNAEAFGASGVITLNGGNLELTNTVSLGSGYTVNLASDAQISVASGKTFSLAGVVSGAGNLTKASSGTLTLTANNTYTGSTTINAGSLQIGANGTSGSIDATSSIVNNSTLTYNRSDAVTLSHIISGTGSLTKAGSGTLTLTGENTYAGTTSVTAGTLQVGAGSTAGSLASGYMTISSGATLSFNRSDDITLTGQITGAGNLSVIGNGVTTITGVASYTGSTTVNNGSIVFTNDSNPSSTSYLGNGTVTIQPAGSAFTGADHSGSYNFASTLTGLTIGNATSSSNSDLSLRALNISGPIALYGGNISLSNLTTTAVGASILLKASGNIKQASGVQVTTNGGNVTYWAGSDGSGVIGLEDEARGISTSGGNIVLAGGSDTNSDGLPDGYVSGLTSFARSTYLGYTNVYYGGVYIGMNATLNAGAGSVTIRGNASNAGFAINGYQVAQTGVQLNSNSSIVGGNITIDGIGTKVGVDLAITSISGNGTVAITGSGGTGTDAYGLLMQNSNVSSGSGQLTLTGSAASDRSGIYMHMSNIGSASTQTGNVAIYADLFTRSSYASYVLGTGALTIQSVNSSFSSDFTLGSLILANTLTGLTLGKSTNTSNMTIYGARNIAGSIEVNGGNISLDGNLTATNNGIIKLKATGNITETGSGVISASGLALLGGNVTLNNTTNNVSTLAASGVGNLSFVNAGNLTIGTVNPTGISATGTVNITTQSGNISLTEAITTSSTASNAIVLNAGATAAAGTATGGNILVSGNGSVSVGNGGRATLYTGSVAGSTGLSSLVASGSGRFRYKSDETTSNYNTTTAALGNGTYVIYRESPTLTLTADSSSMTYGGSTPTLSYTVSGEQNGDTTAQIFSTNATASVGGSSTAAGYTAGNHTVTASGAVDKLGYTISYVNGTLAVSKITLSTAGTTVVDRAYDGTVDATLTNNMASGILASDLANVTVNLVGAFADKNVANNMVVTSNISLTGTAADNYTFTQPVSLTGSITPKTVTLSAAQVYSGSNMLTNVTIGTGVAGETLTYTGALANSANVADNSTNYISAITLGNQSGANATSGGLVSNYQLPTLNHTNAPVTLSAAPLVITSNAANMTYNGTGYTGGTVSYSGFVGSDSAASMTGAIAFGGDSQGAVNAGSYNITASGLSNSNYQITYNTGALTINRANLTITANNTSSQYGLGTNLTAVGYTTSGLVNNETIGSVTLSSSGSANTSSVGTYNITASGAANGTFTASNYNISYANGTLTVTPANLTITANSTATQYGLGTTLGSTAFTASGLQNGETVGNVTLASAGSAATTNVGNYSITASAAANGTFTASNYNISYVAGNLEVTPANISVVANSQTRAYGAANPTSGLVTVNGTLYNGDTLATATVTSSANATSNVGNYTLTANALTFTNGSASNYNISYTNGVLGVTQANLTITANSTSTQYGLGTNLTVVGYTTTGLVNNESIGSVTLTSNGSAGSANVGNYSITASSATDNGPFLTSNYNISYVNGSLAVTQANITVTANDQSRTYGASNPTSGNVTLTTGSLYNGDTLSTATLASNANATSNVGNYTLTASNQTMSAGLISNYNVTYANGTLTVNPANATVTANSANLTYNGSQQSVSGFTAAGLVNGETVAVLTNVSAGGSGTNAGNYATTATGTAQNYNLTFVDGTLTIGKAALTVTGNTSNVSYTGQNQSVSGFTVSGLQGSDTVAVLTNVSASGANGTNAGTYTNTVTVGSESNYNVTGINGALNIGKVTLTVAADNQTRLYGDSNPTLTQTITGYVNSENASTANVSGAGTATTTATNLTGVGNYTIASSVGNLTAANYDFTAANGTLTINKAHLTVTANDQTRVYGSANPTFTQTITGFVNGENASSAGVTGTATGSSTANTTTNVGNYTIAGGVGTLNAANYDFTAANGVLTINKAQLSAVGNKIYDGLITLNGSQMTVSGVNGETFTATGSATMGTKNVQTNQSLASLAGLTLTGVNGSLISNYDSLTTSNTSVSVTPLAVTLSAPNVTKVYDGSTLKTTTSADLATLSSQLVGGDGVSSAQIVYNTSSAGAGKRVTLNSVVIDDGNNGNNYQVSVADALTGVITKAPLTVTAVSDAKFVTQSDQAGYAGVIYTGFVNGETASALTTGSIARSNSATNSAGTYTNVLTASGWSAANYDITYQAGSYTIVPANALLVRAAATTTTYGTAPTYNVTAQYLASNGSIISAPSVSANNQVMVIDGAGGSAQFSLSAMNGSYSSSNNLQVGGYNLGATNVSITGNNFNSLVTVGSLTVNAKTLSNNLGIQSVSKVYDGSTSLTGASLTFDRTLAGVLGADVVTLSGSGSYDNRNVGANKTVSVSMLLSGADANNYALTTTSANISGTITQLSSVTYTGSNGGDWSNSNNWAGGALPDGNNVAQVIIPIGVSVVYNSDQVGVIGSLIQNNGTIIFNSANPFTLSNSVSGSGTLQQRGSGMLTVSGNNSLNGTIDIGAYALTLASANALGMGTVVSNDGRLSLTGTLAQLSVDGAVTLVTAANTSGDQRYNGPLTFLSSGTPYDASTQTAAVPNFYSSLGNISFLGTVSAGAGSKSAQRNLVVAAPNGTVLFNDQVGQDVVASRVGSLSTISFAGYNQTGVNPYAVDVSAQTIKLFADVTSFEAQQYRGAVLVGDNGNNGNTRLLLSMDPAISFTSSIDDVVAGQHSLMLRAITIPQGPTPSITVRDVGLIRELAGLDILVGRQNMSSVVADITPSRYDYAGTINLLGSVTTTNDQRYVGNEISLTSGSSGNNLRSQAGTIEMITGLTNGSLTGLSGANFSFGLNAGGLGANLGGQAGVRTSRDQRPASAQLSAQFADAGSNHHGKQWRQVQEDQRETNQLVNANTDAGEVEIGDIMNVNCDPKADESCRSK